MIKMISKFIAFTLGMLFFSQIAFADDTSSNWLKVDQLSQRQDFLIDKGELCKYLINTYEYVAKTTPPSLEYKFTDIDPQAQPYIIQASSLGLVNSTNPTTFTPSATVTKADLAVTLYKLIKIIYPSADLTGGENIIFPDNVSETDLIPLQFMYSRGIMEKTKNGTLEASTPITLGQTIDTIIRTIATAPDFPVLFNHYSSKRAYLTFDDGTSANTIKILDTLKKYNVFASFFITGKSDPTIIKRIAEEGHTIGNHTNSHNYFAIYASPENFWADFNIEQEYLSSVSGQDILFMRFPGGSNNTVSVKAGGTQIMKTLTMQAKEKGYFYVDWNVSSGDASGKLLPKDTIVNNVLNGAKDKQDAVILMHQIASKTTTAEALPEIIEGLQKMGFEILPLSKNSYLPQFLK